MAPLTPGALRPFERSGGVVDPRDRLLAAEFGLPPPPPENTGPALRGIWDRLFGRPLTSLRLVATEPTHDAPQLHILGRELPQPSIARQPVRQPKLSNAGHANDSGNWAGAYATANSSSHFGTMFGLWEVPSDKDMKVPPGNDPAAFACSVWIGLDGQRRYFDSSLPQIGTLTQFTADGKRDDFAWVQWWERGNPLNNFTRLNLPVAPGDRIGAFLHVLDAQSVWFVIVNLTADRMALAFRVSVPVGGAQPIVWGATAEWIVERPSHPGLKTMFNLPDFGHCELTGLAVQAPRIGAPLYDGTVRDLSYARLLRMLEIREEPSRTAIIAMPHRAGPTAVNVTHGGF